jgi:hypothetical protein
MAEHKTITTKNRMLTETELATYGIPPKPPVNPDKSEERYEYDERKGTP